MRYEHRRRSAPRPRRFIYRPVALIAFLFALFGGGQARGAEDAPLPAAQYAQLIARYHKSVSSGHRMSPSEAREFLTAFSTRSAVVPPDGTPVVPDNSAEVAAMKRIANTPKGSEPDEDTRSRAAVLNRIVHPVPGTSLNGLNIGDVAHGVLSGGEFDYHKPKIPQAKLGWLKRWLKSAGDAMGHFFDWLFRGLGKKTPDGPNLSGFAGFVKFFFIAVLVIAVAAACAFFGLKIYQKRARFRFRRNSGALADTGLDLGPDEVGDPIAAARRLGERGDYRGAIRLAYIASLRALATDGSITITIYRTNWEYQRELFVNAAEKAAILQPATRLFDRVWYGHRNGTPAEFALAISVYERLTGMGATPDANASYVGTGQAGR